MKILGLWLFLTNLIVFMKTSQALKKSTEGNSSLENTVNHALFFETTVVGRQILPFSLKSHIFKLLDGGYI